MKSSPRPTLPTDWKASDSGEAYARQVAAHRGWVLNPDASFTAPIMKGLARRGEIQGRPTCPCRDAEAGDTDLVCPCRYAPEDLAEWGQCYCGLFLAGGKAPGEVSSIPERRPN